MRTSRVFQAVGSHTEGRPTRVIIGGVGVIPGASMAERRVLFIGSGTPARMAHLHAGDEFFLCADFINEWRGAPIPRTGTSPRGTGSRAVPASLADLMDQHRMVRPPGEAGATTEQP